MGRLPVLNSLSQMSVKDARMKSWLKDAGFNLESDEISQFVYCCTRAAPVTTPMLPKLLALLRIFHESDRKGKFWYYSIQDAIKLKFRTEGDCVFFDGSQQIMNEEKDFDWEKAYNDVIDKINNMVAWMSLMK
jgi:hypothetical protein